MVSGKAGRIQIVPPEAEHINSSFLIPHLEALFRKRKQRVPPSAFRHAVHLMGIVTGVSASAEREYRGASSTASSWHFFSGSQTVPVPASSS